MVIDVLTLNNAAGADVVAVVVLAVAVGLCSFHLRKDLSFHNNCSFQVDTCLLSTKRYDRILFLVLNFF